jgi:galactonate dehydratase
VYSDGFADYTPAMALLVPFRSLDDGHHMKLTSIEATVAYPRENSGDGIPIIAVHTDSGLTGWGEAQASRAPDAVCDIVRDLLSPALKNRGFRGDREEIESLWDRMYAIMRNDGQTGGFALEAISAVDIALWDLAGNARRQAIHEIAGPGPRVTEVQAFATLDGADANVLTGAVESLRDAGFDVFELMHSRGADQLIVALDLVKRILGDGGRVAVNAQWRLDPERDYSFARQIDQHAPLWLANPLPPEDPFEHGRLAKTMGTPLALGESYHTHYELAPFFHERAVGVLQLDLGRCGLTEAFRMAEMAKGQDVRVAVRVGESLGPQLAAALQFAAAAPDRLVEYSHKRLKTANRVLARPIEMKQGKYQLCTGPGLGIGMEEAELHLMETQAA